MDRVIKLWNVLKAKKYVIIYKTENLLVVFKNKMWKYWYIMLTLSQDNVEEENSFLRH